VRVAAKGGVAGGEVDVMIRPERLRLLAGGETPGADNSFEMILDDIINYGDSILAIGKTRGLPLRARLVHGTPDVLQPGAMLKLAWAPADAHVIARDRTETSMGRSL
jgi:ABC-type Fe3+/spermidine/putrescine transport system ATPase subunit